MAGLARGSVLGASDESPDAWREEGASEVWPDFERELRRRDRRTIGLRCACSSARRGVQRGSRGCMRCIQAASGFRSKPGDWLLRQRVRPFPKRPANGWMGRLFSSLPLSVWGGIWAFRAHPPSQGSIFHDGLASPASAVAGGGDEAGSPPIEARLAAVGQRGRTMRPPWG
jgi:hypothetical protein